MGCKKIRISINKDLAITNLVGVNINKEFMPSVANIVGTNLTNYKIIKKNQFVYNNMQVARDRTIRIVRYADETPSIMSPAYKIFQVIDKNTLNAEFLMLYFLRPEFDRLCWFYTDSSIRGSLDWVKFCSLEVPVLPINIQEKIVNIYNFINERIYLKNKINKNLEEQLSLLFNDWFVNCTPFKNEELIKSEWGVVPESWKDIEFGELIEITSGNRPDEKSEDKTSEFNIPLFGASKIMGYTKEYSYNEDILIIGRVGTHGVVQRVNYPCFPSDNTFVIKSDYYGFVYQLLKRIDYDSLNTGSTQPLITQKSLKTVNAVLPDEKILSKFEMISKTIFDKIQLNNDEISKLTKLRDTLLPKLMSGEIDVSKINCYFLFQIFQLNFLAFHN
ncbi:restriction endonuclease subunit S [Methanobrevibacter smithii]|uniref:restriction endonuclease subunit S n=1 Tax=Methanobrevibacter smithii TaxID=2173 RepID=UPI0037DC742C